jgi:hypothetical protein
MKSNKQTFGYEVERKIKEGTFQAITQNFLTTSGGELKTKI